MSATLYYRWGLRGVGGLLLLIGIGHMLLPTHGYSAEAVASWSAESKEYFYYQTTYMVGTLLLFLSLISFIYSSQRPSRPIAWFATTSTILWLVRLFLEIKFPVTLKLYFIAQPHYIVMATLGVIILLYALASSIAWGTLLIKK